MIKEFNILKDRVVKVIQLTFSNKKTLSTSKNKYIYIYIKHKHKWETEIKTQMEELIKPKNGKNKTN